MMSRIGGELAISRVDLGAALGVNEWSRPENDCTGGLGGFLCTKG